MKQITLKDLLAFGDNYYDAINFVDSNRATYPSRPSHPSLAKNHTSYDVRKYAELVKAYEREMLIYKIQLEHWRESNGETTGILEDYLKLQSGLTKIPVQYQDKVWENAWSRGHSDGYAEVYSALVNLVDIFN